VPADNENGGEERKPRDAAPRGRSTADARKQATRKANVKQSLVELANLMDATAGRTNDVEPEDLAGIIRRDAEAMAETMANLAARAEPFAFLTDRVFGPGGPLSILVSFGPFLRSLITRAREIRLRQLEDEQPEPEPAPWEPQPAAE